MRAHRRRVGPLMARTGPRWVNRTKKLVARGLTAAVGDAGYRKATGPQRARSSSLLGPLVDPKDVPDPFADGAPAGCRTDLARDAIVPVYDPRFVAPGRVEWDPGDLVIGVEIGGEALAYPVAYLNKREMVLDRFGDIPLLVTWCPRCATAVTYRREVDGEEIILGNQGALCDEAMTFWDHDTGSIWSQPTGMAIAGPRKGETLERLPSTLTTWRAWQRQCPGTVALRAPGRPGHYELGQLCVVVSLLGDSAAYRFDWMRSEGVVNDAIGGRDIVVMVDPTDADRWGAFSRTVDGSTLTMERRDDRTVDTETGTEWSASTGVAEAGPLAGQSLARVAAFTATPADYSRIWPSGTLHG